VGKSVLFKPLNIQTAFTFFRRFVCWKIFFLLFQWRKAFSRLALAVRPWHSSALSPRSNLAFKADAQKRRAA